MTQQEPPPPNVADLFALLLEGMIRAVLARGSWCGIPGPIALLTSFLLRRMARRLAAQFAAIDAARTNGAVVAAPPSCEPDVHPVDPGAERPKPVRAAGRRARGATPVSRAPAVAVAVIRPLAGAVVVHPRVKLPVVRTSTHDAVVAAADGPIRERYVLRDICAPRFVVPIPLRYSNKLP